MAIASWPGKGYTEKSLLWIGQGESLNTILHFKKKKVVLLRQSFPCVLFARIWVGILPKILLSVAKGM